MDIGAGRGYLSRLLALHFGWDVLAVESQQLHVDAAWKLDAAAMAAVGPGSIDWVCASVEQDRPAWLTGSRLMLVALHACGDLSTKLLRLGAECDSVVGLCVVGCCYMHLTEECAEAHPTHQIRPEPHPNNQTAVHVEAARAQVCASMLQLAW